jgi:lysophospholipase L1-like esterase
MSEQFMQSIMSKLSENEQQQMKAELRDMFVSRAQKEKQEKVNRYRRLNTMVQPHQILFVGSSLMEQFPIYELLLDEQLPYTIYNRGIGGYTTQELRATLDVCVYELEPDYIYINIGTNDLNAPGYTEDGLIDRYREILVDVKNHLPQAKLRMLAYYPVNPVVAENNPYMKEALKQRTNERIQSANAAVAELAGEVGAVYIDANAGITDSAGMLREEYTIEGMHMYGDGYRPVLHALKPYLEKDYQEILSR